MKHGNNFFLIIFSRWRGWEQQRSRIIFPTMAHEPP